MLLICQGKGTAVLKVKIPSFNNEYISWYMYSLSSYLVSLLNIYALCHLCHQHQLSNVWAMSLILARSLSFVLICSPNCLRVICFNYFWINEELLSNTARRFAIIILRLTKHSRSCELLTAYRCWHCTDCIQV